MAVTTGYPSPTKDVSSVRWADSHLSPDVPPPPCANRIVGFSCEPDHPKGSIVTGTVKDVDARGAQIELEGGIEGQLRASELSRDRVEDARTVLKVGEEVEAKFTGLDRKTRIVSLSIKAKEAHDEAEAVESYKSDKPSP